MILYVLAGASDTVLGLLLVVAGADRVDRPRRAVPLLVAGLALVAFGAITLPNPGATR